MRKYKIEGFTLIELVIIVTLVGILAVIGAPAMSDFLERKKLQSQVQVINSALSTARVEAVTRLQNVRVCWNDTAANITRNTAVITPGSMAVVVPAVGGNAAVEIRNIEYEDDGLHITEDDGDNCIAFNPQGRLAEATGATFRFSVCKEAADAANSQNISVRASGRAITTENQTANFCN